VVSPDEMVARYGADAARLYSLFAAPPDRDLDWQDSGIEGIRKFLGRVYRFVAKNAQPDHPDWRKPVPAELPPVARAVQRKLHQTIKRVSDDFRGRWHFNTCIAAIMELVNELYTAGAAFQPGAFDPGAFQTESEASLLPVALLAEVQHDLVLLIAPFAPHLASELWEMLGEKTSLLRTPWPKYDPILAKEEEIEIPVQVNGKLRGLIVVPADSSEDVIRERALSNEKVNAAIAGKQVVKVIVVPGKLANIVVR